MARDRVRALWRAARKLSLIYQVEIVYDVGPGVDKTVWFPRPLWFVMSRIVLLPDGYYPRDDGSIAVIKSRPE